MKLVLRAGCQHHMGLPHPGGLARWLLVTAGLGQQCGTRFRALTLALLPMKED